MLAARGGHLPALRCLLERGASVDAVDDCSADDAIWSVAAIFASIWVFMSVTSRKRLSSWLDGLVSGPVERSPCTARTADPAVTAAPGEVPALAGRTG